MSVGIFDCSSIWPKILQRLVAAVFCASILGAAGASKSMAQTDDLVVYTAKKIITMDPTNPIATAVAVRGNRIVSVGSLDDLRPWLASHPHSIDDRFKDKVIMPGLIDPHLHPLLAALQFGTVWITPEAWSLHDSDVPATTSQKQYRERLVAALADAKGDGKPIFITWGWSEPEHGPMTREYLDQIAPDRPVMIWQRSIHEAVFNTAALEFMGLDDSVTENYSPSEIDWEKGHFVEAGFFEAAVSKLAFYLMDPNFVDQGFQRARDYFAANGVTTVGDLSTGQIDWDLELGALYRNYVERNAPFRIVLVPAAHLLSLTKGGLDASFTFVDEQLSRTDGPAQIVYGKRIKLFADGAMFSQMMQVFPPGYIDGHEGEWVTPQDAFKAQARKYWENDYTIHVHTNGDAGISFTLDVFEQLQREIPRLPNALVFEHFGFANASLIRRIADLGASVSANPYYLTALGDTYAELGLGYDRARRIAPVSMLVDRNVPVALHSDFGMAPANPLFLAWSAITRQTNSGAVFQPPRGLTREEALKAVTVDAAYILGLEDQIGSIESGKKADFSILEADPATVPIDQLKDITVWGVMFEGEVHQAVGGR
jgi:predicted amidohydrolase YtcJ